MNPNSPIAIAIEMKSALLIIDVQVGIARGKEICAGWPTIIGNIAKLISDARSNNVPVIFVQHDGTPGDLLEPGCEGWALCPELGVKASDTASDTVIRKSACDSFYGTNLEVTLRNLGVTRLIVTGCMTEFCVDTSVRRAVSLGFDVTLASDAHGTWNSAALDAGKIIEHHNGLLNQFSAGRATVTVTPSRAVAFA